MSNPVSAPLIPYVSSEVEGLTRVKGFSADLMLHVCSFLDVHSLLTCTLGNKRWKQLFSDQSLWKNVLKTYVPPLDLLRWNSNIMRSCGYSTLASIFTESARFGIAMALAAESLRLYVDTGAYRFGQICQKACDIKDYKTAMTCQQIAARHNIGAGNMAMKALIKSQVTDEDFLEKAEGLIQATLALVEADYAFGLQNLIAIAKRFADLGKLESAMEYTELTDRLRKSKVSYSIRRDFAFQEMGKHMLSLKQYDLAAVCAEKNNDIRLFAAIIQQQIDEDNFVNTALLSKLKEGCTPWVAVVEKLAWGLIKHGRHAEALEMARMRLSVNWSYGKYEFCKQLETKLDMKVLVDAGIYIWEK